MSANLLQERTTWVCHEHSAFSRHGRDTQILHWLRQWWSVAGCNRFLGSFRWEWGQKNWPLKGLNGLNAQQKQIIKKKKKIIKFFQLHAKRQSSSNFSNFMKKDKNHQIIRTSWKKSKIIKLITSGKKTIIIKFFQLEEKRQETRNSSYFMKKDKNHQIFPSP